MTLSVTLLRQGTAKNVDLIIWGRVRELERTWMTRNSSIEIRNCRSWKTYTFLIYIKRAEKWSAPLQIYLYKIFVCWTNLAIDAPCNTRPADDLSPLREIQGFLSPSPILRELSFEKIVRLFSPVRVLSILLPVAVCWPPWFWSVACSLTYEYNYPIVRTWRQMRMAKRTYLCNNGEHHKWCQAQVDSVHHHIGQLSCHSS